MNGSRAPHRLLILSIFLAALLRMILPCAQATTSNIVLAFVGLDAPPIAVVYAQMSARDGVSVREARAIIQQHRAEIDAAQQTLAAALTDPAIGATIAARPQWILNGIVVRVDANQLLTIRALPGVAYVQILYPDALDGTTPQSPPPELSQPTQPNKPPGPPQPGHPVIRPATE